MTSKQPIVILGSARKHSDTRQLVDAIFDKKPVTILELLDYKIEPYCYEEIYSEEDEFLNVVHQLMQHSTIIFATPVYWYSMSTSMKTFFDRLTDLLGSQKALGKQLKGKKCHLISVSASLELPNGFEVPFRETATYFDMDFISTFYCCKDDIKTASVNSLDFQQSIN